MMARKDLFWRGIQKKECEVEVTGWTLRESIITVLLLSNKLNPRMILGNPIKQTVKQIGDKWDLQIVGTNIDTPLDFKTGEESWKK